jgi:NAD(P)-dependent dehydrogenase (short-subunit alcohol dehydrogenase family)
VEYLRDKRVVVTGAASGIGRGAALAFAAEDSSLLLVDIDEEGLATTADRVRARGVECASFVVDVSDESQTRRFGEQVAEEHGAVDVLVNVAGVCVVADFVDIPLEDWHWVVGVNLWGPSTCAGRFYPECSSAAAAIS